MSSVMSDVEVYAVPGAHNAIDTINIDTGLTRVFGHTEAEVIAENPGAVRMTWADWTAAEAARQHTPITWQRLRGTPEQAEKEYNEMLNVLPPAAWIGGAFLVGEPMDHDVSNGRPRFEAFWYRHAHYYKASRPLTCAEFRAEIEARR